MALYRVTLKKSEGGEQPPATRAVYVVSTGYAYTRRKAERLHPVWKATRTNRVG